MANSGVSPVDATTNIGKVRLLVADVNSVPLAPPVTGYADYTYFSDAEISAFLTSSSDSVLGAVGYAYMSLAGQAALAAESITDYDLKIDTTKKAADLQKQAQVFFTQAGITGGAESFDIVETGTDPYRPPYEYYPYPLPQHWIY